MSKINGPAAVAPTRPNPLREGNKFKLGLFGLSLNTVLISNVDTSFELTWDHTSSIAKKADAIGLDFLLPPARWSGFGGLSRYMSDSFDTFTWAAAASAVTERIAILATTHVPVVHPIVAAKQSATIDHVSGGRFGLNLTMGWFKQEMEMFGAEQRQHDTRYAYGAEWVDVIERLWTDAEPFDYKGEFLELKHMQSSPKPVQSPRPILVNAGNSGAGLEFSAKYVDYNFASIETLEKGAALVEQVVSLARDTYKRSIGVMTYGIVVCRPTEEEARAAYQEIVDDADWETASRHRASSGAGSESFRGMLQDQKERFVTGGGWPIVGTPNQVAQQIAAFHDIGITGFAMILRDYAAELPYIESALLPRLQELGLRA